MQYLVKTNYGNILVSVNDGNGKLESELKREVCPGCGDTDCNYGCGEVEPPNGFEEFEGDDPGKRLIFNGSLDVLEALVLAHACSGIDVASESYIAGLNVVLDKLSNTD